VNINQYIPVIATLCKQHKVNKLFAFGSILTGRFNEDSDIDLVVDFKDVDLMDYVDNYFAFRDALTQVLGREVDLLEDKAIRNPVLRRNIDNSKVLIYG
jgi:predicted nucleotidyltransferase